MAAEAAHYANQYAQFMHHHVLSKMGGKSRVVGLKQTKATTRAGKRKTGGRNKGARPGRARAGKRAKSNNPHRHETLPNRLAKPVPKGKGYNNKATGIIRTHPRSVYQNGSSTVCASIKMRCGKPSSLVNRIGLPVRITLYSSRGIL